LTNIELPVQIDTEHDYVTRHFWSLDQLAEACGCDADTVLGLIGAGCPIYALPPGGAWWSALAARRGQASIAPSKSATIWYAPSAAWGLRTARLLLRDGATPATAAQALRAQFGRCFIDALGGLPGAPSAFPTCFTTDGGVGKDAAQIVADEEWSAWLSGAYAVCLRVFTAETCIRKEALAAQLKAALHGHGEPHTDIERVAMAEALAGLILPFAPWERPHCTPGLTIDHLLQGSQIGRERPYD
jgi:hypothetical protein